MTSALTHEAGYCKNYAGRYIGTYGNLACFVKNDHPYAKIPLNALRVLEHVV